jgi:hypothetical protein
MAKHRRSTVLSWTPATTFTAGANIAIRSLPQQQSEQCRRLGRGHLANPEAQPQRPGRHNAGPLHGQRDRRHGLRLLLGRGDDQHTVHHPVGGQPSAWEAEKPPEFAVLPPGAQEPVASDARSLLSHSADPTPSCPPRGSALQRRWQPTHDDLSFLQSMV